MKPPPRPDCAPHMAFILEDCRGSSLRSLPLSPRAVINCVKCRPLSCKSPLQPEKVVRAF